MKEISELQQKRAVNLIWTGAGDHGFTPDFKAYDANGDAELYWNIIIGALRRHYDYPKIEKLFRAFQQYEERDVYEGLLWLGLENCVYQRELPERPILESLRRAYAEDFLREYGSKSLDDYRLLDCLSTAHYMRILGAEPLMSKYDIKLLDELEFSPEIDTDGLVSLADTLFRRWFQISTKERQQKRELQFRLKRRQNDASKTRYRKFGRGVADHPSNIYGGADTSSGYTKEIRTKMSASELRLFMGEKYGRCIFTPVQTMEIERELCRGNHSMCHLHFTRGEPVGGRIQNGFEALQKRREAEQMARNRAVFRENIVQNRIAISKLTEKIQNSVLMYLQPSFVKADSGRLNGGLAWRALKLDDSRVFSRSQQDNIGDFSVDILLDASTSQRNRQESVSGQGYIIAEALTRCNIPCRVMSFCSMTGYTILRIYRDYSERAANDRIFDYVSNGCNRDGLAIRAAHYLIKKTEYEHKMLIILSDVKPNDVIKIRRAENAEPIQYEGFAGVRDTAFEVRRTLEDGIAVMCIFTGNEDDLSSAKTVYGRNFARIRSMDQLAEAVGKLIQNQIRIM